MRSRHALVGVTAVTLLCMMLVPATAQAAGSGRPLSTPLSGADEVPAADSDGSGVANLRLNPGQGTVCFELTVTNIGSAVAAHIHHAVAGTNGPVVVPLAAPTTGTSSGCIEDVDRGLVRAIIQNPQEYYVNVHTQAFPGGAIRGQLG